jgi:putative ABC transport system permease protein
MSFVTKVQTPGLWAQGWSFARRDLRGSKTGLRLLAICLFLGIATLAGIGSLTSAILADLSSRGQVILGGDVQMQVSQRFATADERAAFARVGAVSQTVRMRAMTSSGDGSNAVLAELKAVDSNYPLYGALRLAPGAIMARPRGATAAIAPTLADKLSVKIGGTIKLGEAQLKVIGFIAEEPDRVGDGFTLGPVVLIDPDAMAATKLVQPGSLYTVRYRIKTPAGRDIAATSAALKQRFASTGWEVQDRTNGAPGTRRFVERLGQFLSLVGLSALIIAGIGVGNGVASWLDGKRGSIATLKVLGASSALIFRIYLIQIIIVALGATLLGLLVGALVPWVVVSVAGDSLPVAPLLALYPVPLALSTLYGVLIALLFSLAPLARARAISAASLFRTGVEGAGRPPLAVILSSVALALVIAVTATLTAREPLFAASFIAAILALLLLLTGLGSAIRIIASRVPRPRAPLARLAIANLHRPGAQTGRLVVALGLGLTLFATLAFIQTSLASQIAKTIPKRAPSFFALDIAKDDAQRFRSRVISVAPDASIQMVPTLRGPIVAINQTRVSEMKNLPPDAWFLRGDRGLTFAADVPPGSQVTAGAWWPKNYAGPPLISLDERAAQAVGLKIGDRLTVSILGTEIEAKIASFRQINWDTLGFNFVLVFSPGSVEAAPYTLAATIAAQEQEEPGVSRAVGAGFPAVSMIKVKDIITQIGSLLTQLAQAVGAAASVAVLSGVAVLVGAIAAARATRNYDAVLLKLLGATRAQILATQAIEYGVLAALVSGIALMIGGGAGYIVMTQVFELGWTPDWPIVLATVAAGGLGTLIIGLLGALSALSARPAEALRTL